MTTIVYDAADHTTAVQYYHGIYLTYGYDAVGNWLTLDDTKAGRTAYGYDVQNRVMLIHNPFDERTSITWDTLDREQRRVFANGMCTSHAYDVNGRETNINTTDSAGRALQRYTATYDLMGNRWSVRELDGTRVSYNYDGAYQLNIDQRDLAAAYSAHRFSRGQQRGKDLGRASERRTGWIDGKPDYC